MPVKVGKMPESVLRRSVWKELKKDHDKVIKGPEVGEDSAVLAPFYEEGTCCAITSDPVIGVPEEVGRRAVHVAVNNLAATGVDPVGITSVILLPLEAKEKHLKMLMHDISKTCDALGIAVLGGHSESTSAVNQVVVTITAIGTSSKERLKFTSQAKEDEDIIMIGYAGMEGTGLIAREKKEQLMERYSEDFIEQGEQLLEEISILKAAELAEQYPISAMHDVRKGGIYGALWELTSAAKVGMRIQLDDIPVKQETVEICEFFDLNPYKLLSGGSLLVTAVRGHELAQQLREAGIAATVIGSTTKDQSRIIVREGEEGYLEPPKSDEIYRLC